MEIDLITYIKNARQTTADDSDIRTMLLAAGWPKEQVDTALAANLDLPLPPPPPQTATTSGTTPTQAPPLAVVQSLSTRGFEYIIMFIALWFTASSLGWILHSLVDGLFGRRSYYETAVSFASAALLVALPVFSILFLRLKSAELNDQNLKHDPSRRKAVQLTLIVTFLIGMLKVIGYLFGLLNGQSGSGGWFSGGGSADPVANLVHSIITLTIAGTIFWYWWHDQHKDH